MEKTVADNAMQSGAIPSVDIVSKDVVLSPEEAARARERSVRIADELRRQMLRGLNRQLFLLKRDKFIYRLWILCPKLFVVFSFFRFKLPLLFFSFIVRITSKHGDLVTDGHGNAPPLDTQQALNAQAVRAAEGGSERAQG